MQVSLPVRWDAAGRSRHRLVERVVAWRREDGTLQELFGRVIPEPVLAGLKALGDRVSFSGGMATRVLRRRRVAAADMTASCAAPEMEPPAILGGEALDAPGATRRCLEIDVFHGCHPPMLSDGATGRQSSYRNARARTAYTNQVGVYIDMLVRLLPPGPRSRATAITALSTLVGAVSMARAVNDEALSREILASAETDMKAELRAVR